MSKKNLGLLSNLYLVGSLLVAVGFCCPVFKMSKYINGFKIFGEAFNNSKNFSPLAFGVILIFIGAVFGIYLCFSNLKNMKMMKIIALAVSILGGIILCVYINDNAFYKVVAKSFLKHAFIGFYMIIVGWIVSIVGYIKGE